MIVDSRRIQADLADRAPRDWSWLEGSYLDPAAFLDGLYDDHSARRKLPVRSKVGVRVGFYSECVHRHGGSNAAALRIFEGGAVRELGYRALHLRVCQRATFLERSGVAEGSVVCVVARMGEALVVDLLALLKIGAVASLLEPRGPLFVLHRLASLAPDFVVASPAYARWWEALEPAPTSISDLGVATDAGIEATCRSYAAGDEAVRLLSPLADDPTTAIPVSADSLFRGAIRDAILVHRLGPGDAIAAPLFDLHQHQPALLLAALLVGATYVHVDPEELRRRPDLLPTLGLRVAGLTAELRANEADERAPFRIGAARWFSSLSDPLDVGRLRYEVDVLAKRGCRGVLTLANAAFGGTFLMTPRPEGSGILSTIPVPGQTWSLGDANGSGMEAISAGVFVSDEMPPESFGRFVMGPSGGEHYFGGAAGLTRSGQVLPTTEIALVAESVPGVLHAALVLGPGRLPNTSRAVLLAFLDTASIDAAIARAIQARIEATLGAALVPDRIELYPLVPQLVDGRPDELWCTNHYFSGRLDKKRGEPLFASLAAARRAVLRAGALAEGAS